MVVIGLRFESVYTTKVRVSSIQQADRSKYRSNVKETNHEHKKVSPPVGASMKINFLASLTVNGVTGTRRLSCQTLILLEKLMKLK